MQLPDGASLAPGQSAEIEKALAALAKDVHAPRAMSVAVLLHIHNEYPKMLYKGIGTKQTTVVADGDAETAARESGWGEYVPEPAQEG